MSAKIVQSSNSDSIPRHDLLIKEWRNHYNHNLQLLQSDISINLYNCEIYYNGAGIQNLHTSIFFCHCSLWVLIGATVEWNSKV